MDEIARQMLRALRGKRSQVAFSRRLGYAGNVAASWEAGRRFPTAAETLRAAAVTGVNVAQAFAAFEPTCVPAAATDEALADWLDRLRGAEKAPALAQRAGISRDAMGRILRGQTAPRLPVFLATVAAITGRLADLAAQLVDITQVPALAEEHRLQNAARDLAFAEPWSVPILRLIETEGFAQEPYERGRLARILGIDCDTEERCLRGLCDAHVIRWQGDTYVAQRPLTVDAKGRPERLWDLKRHWAEIGANFVGREAPPNRFSYNLFSCSAADLEKIRELQWQFYHQVRGIVAASAPVERVALLNMQLVEWAPTRAGP